MTRQAAPGKPAVPRRVSGIRIDPEKLAGLRESRAMSPEELAARISDTYADAWRLALLIDDRGEGARICYRPMASTARMLCTMLDCEPEDLSLDTLARVGQFQNRPLADLAARITAEVTRVDATGERVPASLSRDAIRKYEKGMLNVRARTLRVICAVLDCSPDDLRAAA